VMSCLTRPIPAHDTALRFRMCRVFDKGAAERHWTALFKLFQETLTDAQ
jgi:hypothetical protein